MVSPAPSVISEQLDGYSADISSDPGTGSFANDPVDEVQEIIDRVQIEGTGLTSKERTTLSDLKDTYDDFKNVVDGVETIVDVLDKLSKLGTLLETIGGGAIGLGLSLVGEVFDAFKEAYEFFDGTENQKIQAEALAGLVAKLPRPGGNIQTTPVDSDDGSWDIPDGSSATSESPHGTGAPPPATTYHYAPISDATANWRATGFRLIYGRVGPNGEQTEIRFVPPGGMYPDGLSLLGNTTVAPQDPKPQKPSKPGSGGPNRRPKPKVPPRPHPTLPPAAANPAPPGGNPHRPPDKLGPQQPGLYP